MSPASFIAAGGPAATARTLKPFPSSSLAAAVAVGDGWARPMTTAKAPFTTRCVSAVRSCCRRLGHLRRRIERHELDHLRRIGDGLAGGGGANGGIDRVLPAIRAGERSQRQNMRLVEAGHRTNARHRQRVTRQRAGLVGAQDIHRRRFVHCGKAGRKNAVLARARAPSAEARVKVAGSATGIDASTRRQHEGDDLGERHLEKIGIGHQQHDNDAVERGEIAHHPQNRLLLRT